MNAGWYPWGSGVNGNTPADYVAAYRHIHDLFLGEGVTNVIWVWSPAALDTAVQSDLAGLYPGDAYVDWVGLSAYFDQQSDTYASTVAPTMRRFDQVAPAKPIYVAEAAVLPGSARPAMIHDLVGGLLAMPRTIGLTWFDLLLRVDSRFDDDPLGLAALHAELTSGWFFPAVGGPRPPPAPLNQVAPLLTGTAVVGGAVSAYSGIWRPMPGTATTYAGRWFRCTDAVSTASCASTQVTSEAYPIGMVDLGLFLRHRVTAVNDGGTTAAFSAPTTGVLTTPVQPAAPGVEANNNSARVIFPAAPAGANSWRLSVDGVPKQLVSTGREDYWLTGLTNGQTYTLALQAVCASATASLSSTPTTGTFAALTAPFLPYVTTGPTATMTLPKAPVGASGWC
jgi:Glycosyl hydrolase family 26